MNERKKYAASRVYNFVPVDQYIKNQVSQWNHEEGIWKEIDHEFHLQFNYFYSMRFVELYSYLQCYEIYRHNVLIFP